MSTAGKLGMVAGIVLALWFAWIAVDVRDEGSPDATAGVRDRETHSGDANQGRPIQRSIGGAANSERDGFALDRREARDASSRAAERRLSSDVAERDLPARRDPQAARVDDAQKRNGAPAAGKSTPGAAPGGPSQKEAQPRFVPGPADLRPGAKLAGADMAGTQLVGIDLTGADLTDADLHDAKMDDINLEDAMLTSANLSGVNMQRGSLVNADLHEARLDGADLRGAELEGAILTDASLTRTNIAGVTFGGADLAGANLRGAMLFGVDLRDTNLENVDFQDADLRDANLTGVDISNALNLTCAQITLARGWQSANRSDDLACGAPLPGDDG